METIYDFIKKQENAYQQDIALADGWNWNMPRHLRRSFLYKNSQFEEQNENRTLRPNKNIVLGILNVQYRTEGFDVKDIELFVNNPDEYYKSFLAKKYHEKWALDNAIDTFIDELVESYCDYGGALVKNIGKKRPEVVDLRTIAFCNQRSILDYPFGFKRVYSQGELKKAAKEQGYGKSENGANMTVNELITLTKEEDREEIEVYEVYGYLPKEYLQDEYQEIDLENDDEMQFQVVAFYKDEKSNDLGVTLYKTRVPDLGKVFKLLKRDDIKDRALGRGVVEELFEPQKWTNWNEIKVVELLEAASKVILLTDNQSVVSKHKGGLKNMQNLELVEVNQDSRGVWQLDNTPRSMALFDRSIAEWENHGQVLGSANDSLQGETPPSGTPFKLYERQTMEAKGMHSYRRGKIATFVDEIYRDWVLPYIMREIVNDNTFLAELSANEMEEVAKRFTKHYVNQKLVEKVLGGKEIKQGEAEELAQIAEGRFMETNKKFIKILKNEFEKKNISVRTNIAGKQKNLDLLTDKLVGVMRQWMQMKATGVDTSGMDNILNTILESSGLSPVMFGYKGGQAQQMNARLAQGQNQGAPTGQLGSGGAPATV